VLDPQDLASVETLLVGAEAVDESTARTWAAGRRMMNIYGPTESTIMVAVAGEPGPRRLGAVRPADREHPAVRARQHAVAGAAGCRGELYLAGEQLARGYVAAGH